MKKRFLSATTGVILSQVLIQSQALAAPGPHSAPSTPLNSSEAAAQSGADQSVKTRLSPLTVPRTQPLIMKRLEQIEALLMKPQERPGPQQKKALDVELTALMWAIEKSAGSAKPDQRLRSLHSYAFYVRGVLHFEMKDMAGSMRFLDCALKDDAKNAKAYEQRGTNFVLSGKPKEGLSDFDSAIKNGLESDFALINRGSMYVTTGENGKAVEDLTRALEKRKGAPGQWMPLMLRAKAYMGLKNYVAARRDATDMLALADAPKSVQSEVQKLVAALDARANEKAAPPPDKPFQAERASLDTLIAPYVEAARKTLPAARERFLKGLPPKEWMSVTTRIYGPETDPGAVKPMEQVFVTVKGWNGASISGALASSVRLPNHSQGEPITVAEKDVLDWTIVRADGSEEGNVVGKFMESTEARAALAGKNLQTGPAPVAAQNGAAADSSGPLTPGNPTSASSAAANPVITPATTTSVEPVAPIVDTPKIPVASPSGATP